MRSFFITGTDTGVGKTFVTAALARRARAREKRVFAFKPIETGCEVFGEEMVGSDQRILGEAAGGWQRGQLVGVYRFTRPVAPWVAARAEGVPIDLARIESVFREGASQSDVALVEGAGGWRVPITAQEDMSDLARRLGVPVIVVARATLGTINHTLLTLEAVERDACQVAGVVISRRPDDDADAARGNQSEIQHRWSGPVLVFDGESSVLDLFL